jgi:hypothetical protein
MSFHERVPKDDRTDETELVAKDADRYGALYALSTSEGGKILLDALRQDISESMDKLSSGYATLAESALRAECANLNVKLAMLWSITRSKENLDGALTALDDLIA